MERVVAVTKIIQNKEKINLNPNNPIAREILDRSSVKTLTDDTKVLYFRSKRGVKEENSGVQILKRGKTSTLLYSNKNTKAHIEYKELINKLKTNHTIDEEYMVDTTPETSSITGLTDNENQGKTMFLNQENTSDQQSKLGDNGTLQTMINSIQETLDETKQEFEELRQEFDEKYRPTSFFNDITNGEVQTLRDKTDEFEQRMNGLEELQNRLTEQRQNEEVRAEQEDISRLQRFKVWAKENLVGVSALTISVAGIITIIIVGVRKAIVKGAQATGKFAKAVYYLGKKLGSLLAPLLNIVTQAIS